MNELLNRTKNLKVLYVEDDVDAREIMKMFLDEFFKEIDIATDGFEALEKFSSGKYDLIISDLNMPNMNGVEFFSEIRQKDKNVSIIVTTAHNEENFIEKCKEIGVNGFFLKPIDLDQFIATIEKIVLD